MQSISIAVVMNNFETLVHIILEQQVSLASALATLNKLREKVVEIVPGNLLKLTDEEFRACYFSRQKTAYVKYLAEAVGSGALDLPSLELLTDEDVKAKLIALKGVGNWTAEIYLIFVLQRADVFPVGDLAAVNALKRLKSLPSDVPREQILDEASQWRPFRTIATMLLWHHYLSSPIKKRK
jgi:DNA-3-methyladenine glycosylase II